MPIVCANLHEIGYGPIFADIFPQKMAKFFFMTKVLTLSSQLLLKTALIRESQLVVGHAKSVKISTSALFD